MELKSRVMPIKKIDQSKSSIISKLDHSSRSTDQLLIQPIKTNLNSSIFGESNAVNDAIISQSLSNAYHDNQFNVKTIVKRYQPRQTDYNWNF